MSDLFDDLDFEMLGGDFEDPFENEPVDPMPPPVPGMPNAGHQPVQHPKAAVQKASEVPRDRHSTASLRPLTKHLRKLSQMQRLRSPKLMTMPQTQLLIKRKFQIKQVLNRSLR